MVPLEFEVMSRETIKPSSPTPHHLRKYQFSFLDQISPPIFMPLIFFYPPDIHDPNNTQRSESLKKSLSLALTHYYPLAGRAIGNLYNNCNDEGVPFIQARSNCQLSDIISNPIPNQLNEFFPCKLNEVTDLSLVVQVTSFTCGGLALAVGFSHIVMDALSCFLLINCWAALARGDSDIICPQFESANLFPPKDMSGFKAGIGIAKEKIVTKRFVISASKIAILRDKYAQYTRRPTRIEALSAFIWARFVSATQAKAGPNKIYSVMHAVNLRTRMEPPVPANYFGNISRLAVVSPSMESEEEECNYRILDQMRDAIRNINGGYIEKLREGDSHLDQMKERGEKTSSGEVVSFSFTSLCRFPLYEADFGWGKPIWVGSASFMFKNLIAFMDTPFGDGIEVWVNLKGEDMAKFEVDKEFLSFVSN